MVHSAKNREKLETTLIDMSVAEIMHQWPETLPVFMKFHLHCIGCPIAGFHTLTDAALEHDLSFDTLNAAMLVAILNREATNAPEHDHQQ
jgi:hybrid cluster-associated redox disulfide protein